jgi:hypothetical protein
MSVTAGIDGRLAILYFEDLSHSLLLHHYMHLIRTSRSMLANGQGTMYEGFDVMLAVASEVEVSGTGRTRNLSRRST